MDNMKFTEEDKKKVVDFLNAIAKHAKFEVSTTELISYFKGLSHMQQVILPKLEANILEVVKVVESEEKPKRTRKK